LTNFNNLLAFGSTTKYGEEFTLSEGTTDKTRIFDLYPGDCIDKYFSNITYPCSSSPSGFTVFDNKLFFASSNISVGRELYYAYLATSATSANIDSYSVVLFLDLYPGNCDDVTTKYTIEPCDSSPDNFIVYNSRLYFVATTPGAGREIWVTTGKTDTSSTYLLFDIYPGNCLDPNSGITIPCSSSPYGFTEFKNRLYFSALNSLGRELWVSNGTSTSMVIDIYTGMCSLLSTTGRNVTTPCDSEPSSFVVYKDKLFFSATSKTYGREIFVTDGTSFPSIFKDLYPGLCQNNDFVVNTPTLQPCHGSPVNLFVQKDILFFAAFAPALSTAAQSQLLSPTRVLWTSDGTTENTNVVYSTDITIDPVITNQLISVPSSIQNRSIDDISCDCGCDIKQIVYETMNMGSSTLIACPPGYRTDPLTCLQECPSDYVDTGLFCQQRYCPTGYTDTGLFCLENCQTTETDMGLTCLSNCNSNEIDTGLFCTYPRVCPSDHPRDDGTACWRDLSCSGGSCHWDSCCSTGLFNECYGCLRCDPITCIQAEAQYKTVTAKNSRAKKNIAKIVYEKKIIGRVNWKVVEETMNKDVSPIFAENGPLANALDPRKNGVLTFVKNLKYSVNELIPELGTMIFGTIETLLNYAVNFAETIKGMFSGLEWWENMSRDPAKVLTLVHSIFEAATLLVHSSPAGTLLVESIKIALSASKLIVKCTRGDATEDDLVGLMVEVAPIPKPIENFRNSKMSITNDFRQAIRDISQARFLNKQSIMEVGGKKIESTVAEAFITTVSPYDDELAALMNGRISSSSTAVSTPTTSITASNTPSNSRTPSNSLSSSPSSLYPITPYSSLLASKDETYCGWKCPNPLRGGAPANCFSLQRSFGSSSNPNLSNVNNTNSRQILTYQNNYILTESGTINIGHELYMLEIVPYGNSYQIIKRLISDIQKGNRSSFPSDLLYLNNTIYFVATNNITGRELYRYNP